MNRARIIAIALAGVAASTAVASTVFWARLPSRMPTDDDYRRVNELIAAAKQPGDIVVLAPAWADRGRQFITGLPVYAGYDLAGDQYPGTRRQWLVALPDVPRFSLSAAREALLARGRGAGEGKRIGELYVEPFSLAGPPMAYSFLAEVPEATVTVEGMRPETCRPHNGGHQCSRGGWNKVEAGWYEVEERPAHCIWAHPVGRDALAIAFPGVPLPAGSRIAGWGAFVGQAPANGGAEVDIAIDVDGHALQPAAFPNGFGRQRFDVSVPASAEKATVTFRVTTPDAGMRHFCFDAWVQPPA